MARRPARESGGPTEPMKTSREKIIDALMGLLAQERIEDIGFGAIARRAGLTLADCRGEFRSVVAVLAAFTKEIDRQVLSGGDADTAEEPPRERLFGVLMRALEGLAPHKAAIRHLARPAARGPGTCGRAARAQPALEAMEPHRRRYQRGRSEGRSAKPGSSAALRVGA